jgi:hypothetical protein
MAVAAATVAAGSCYKWQRRLLQGAAIDGGGDLLLATADIATSAIGGCYKWRRRLLQGRQRMAAAICY